ncbi:MAG: hypothetical protein ACLR5S_10820 [Ruminococcus sp.]
MHLEHLLVKQAEFPNRPRKLSDSTLYQTVEKYIQTQSIQLQIYEGICRSVMRTEEELADMPLHALSSGNVCRAVSINDRRTIYIAFCAGTGSTWNEMS